MWSTRILLVTAVATLASALPSLAPAPVTIIPDAGVFHITSFYNGGSRFSTEARISFEVSSSNPSAPLNNVLCSFEQSIQPTVVSSTPPTFECGKDTGLSFLFRTTPVGYFLAVSHVTNKNTTVDSALLYMGEHVETIVDKKDPNGNYQELVYPANFEMGFTRVKNCC